MTTKYRMKRAGTTGRPAPVAVEPGQLVLDEFLGKLYTLNANDNTVRATDLLVTAPDVNKSYVDTAIAAITFLSLAGFNVNLAARTDGTAFTVSPTMPTPTAGDNTTKAATTAFVTGALTAKAPLASPALTGTPTAPTAAVGTNTTQVASTAFVTATTDAAVANLLASAPGALNTLNELAAALGNDANFAATMTNNLALKVAKAANLSDLANVATAWTNLGGGTLGKQAANAVAITGGTLTGVTLTNVTIDEGTY